MKNQTKSESVTIPAGYGSQGHSYPVRTLGEWGAKLYPIIAQAIQNEHPNYPNYYFGFKSHLREIFKGRTREIGLNHDQIWAWAQAVKTIRQARATRRSKTIPTLRENLNERLVALCEKGMRESKPTGWNEYACVLDYDSPRRLWLVGGETRYHYSNFFGDWWTGSAFLCGRTEAGRVWVSRVPKNISSVGEALEYLKPAAVRRAEKEGRKIFRQGDIFFVEQRTKNFKDLPRSHRVQEDGRTIVHEEHGTLALPHARFKAMLRKTVHGAMVD